VIPMGLHPALLSEAEHGRPSLLILSCYQLLTALWVLTAARIVQARGRSRARSLIALTLAVAIVQFGRVVTHEGLFRLERHPIALVMQLAVLALVAMVVAIGASMGTAIACGLAWLADRAMVGARSWLPFAAAGAATVLSAACAFRAGALLVPVVAMIGLGVVAAASARRGRALAAFAGAFAAIVGAVPGIGHEQARLARSAAPQCRDGGFALVAERVPGVAGVRQSDTYAATESVDVYVLVERGGDESIVLDDVRAALANERCQWGDFEARMLPASALASPAVAVDVTLEVKRQPGADEASIRAHVTERIRTSLERPSADATNLQLLFKFDLPDFTRIPGVESVNILGCAPEGEVECLFGSFVSLAPGSHPVIRSVDVRFVDAP